MCAGWLTYPRTLYADDKALCQELGLRLADTLDIIMTDVSQAYETQYLARCELAKINYQGFLNLNLVKIM